MGLPGHTAAAFAAKALDLLCFPFPATGIEHTGADPWLPWSHGLFMTAVWSLVAGAIAPVACRDGRTGAAIALLVLSHWVFGFVSH
ncbi:MAG: hypothetical protein QME94_03470, partial [Anaerolineae bacterium]|nr:hypothetical protein [Anaerolineae bacterium]